MTVNLFSVYTNYGGQHQQHQMYQAHQQQQQMQVHIKPEFPPQPQQHHQPPPLSFHPQQNNFHNVNALASPPPRPAPPNLQQRPAMAQNQRPTQARIPINKLNSPQNQIISCTEFSFGSAKE